MSGGTKALHELLLAARRAAGMTQSELARKVGCQQSAISMFESGRPESLSEEKVRALAKVLGVDSAARPGVPVGPAGSRSVLKYCPVDDCPSNVPYAVRGQVCLAPTLVMAEAAERTHCRDCGELLESACPNDGCGAPVSPGAFCPACGTAYVTPGGLAPEDGKAWIAERRAAIAQLRTVQKVRWIGGPPPGATPGRERKEDGR